MAVKLRKKGRVDLSTIVDEIPHYYEVRIPNHPNGVPQVCCGTWGDVEGVLALYPDASVKKCYPPNPPGTVNVTAETIGKESALNEGAPALPESQLIEL